MTCVCMPAGGQCLQYFVPTLLDWTYCTAFGPPITCACMPAGGQCLQYFVPMLLDWTPCCAAFGPPITCLHAGQWPLSAVLCANAGLNLLYSVYSITQKDGTLQSSLPIGLDFLSHYLSLCLLSLSVKPYQPCGRQGRDPCRHSGSGMYWCRLPVPPPSLAVCLLQLHPRPTFTLCPPGKFTLLFFG